MATRKKKAEVETEGDEVTAIDTTQTHFVVETEGDEVTTIDHEHEWYTDNEGATRCTGCRQVKFS